MTLFGFLIGMVAVAGVGTVVVAGLHLLEGVRLEEWRRDLEKPDFGIFRD